MSLWPDRTGQPYGASTYGGAPRGPTLRDLRLVPPLHLPDRLGDVGRLGREPTPWDVQTATRIGGFDASLPLIVPAMGSTPVAHRVGAALGRAAAQAGVPLVIGENVATVHGYDEPKGDLPTLKQRAMAYLGALAPDGPGGLVFQSSVEDAMDELWWRIYSDPDFEAYMEAGRIGFEIKVGQGAKPGLGGITLLDAHAVDGVGREYALGAPRPDGKVERFSAPGTFTTDILTAQVKHLRNDFPKARAWVKLPPSSDVFALAAAAAAGGADAVTMDGAEAGTALAPQVFLDHVGLPTLALAAGLRGAEQGCDVILSGGMQDGADLVKAVAMGATAIGLGRAPLEAAITGEAGTWFEERLDEVRKLTYAMGHLDTGGLTAACLRADDKSVAEAVGVQWTFAAARWVAADPPTF